MSATANSGILTNAFHNLVHELVIDFPNFDLEEAFWRSVKVFLTAYAGYDILCPHIFAQKLNEWMDAMKLIYYVPNPNIGNFAAIQNDITNQMMEINVGIKKVRGLNLCKNLRVVVSSVTGATPELPINMNTEKQDSVCIGLNGNFNQYRDFRINRAVFKITAIADSWVDTNEPLNEFSIDFSEISAEGFEDWFYVGRGVEFLIKIFVSVIVEPGTLQTYPPKFHVHSIMLMLGTRRFQYDSLDATHGKKHRTPANKSKITYIRKRVNPNSETAFWSNFKSVPDIMEQIRTQIVERSAQNYSQISDILSKRVKFVDIQISTTFCDDYEDLDPVCLCSEWCNWNAFGHYNPEFRHLMVCHNKLYLSNKTNVADMYLYCSANCIRMVEQQMIAGQPPSKAPILRLLNDANHIRQINFRKYYMIQRSYRNQYQNCRPSFEALIGLSYKILRDQTISQYIILESAEDPFSDICFENITNFIKVLNDLHLFIGGLPIFVPLAQNRFWFWEMDDMSRKDYCNYMLEAYKKSMTVLKKNPNYDFIFTEDLEYSNVLVRTDDQKLVKQITGRVHRFALPVNPFNIRVTIEPIIATIVGVYKILNKVGAMLSKPSSNIPLQEVFKCLQTFDDELDRSFIHCDFLFVTDFEDHSRGPMDLQNCQKYYFFYTLKLYLIGYGIQKHCIKSVMDCNKIHRIAGSIDVCPHFQFIFKINSYIEDKYQTLYNESIFDIQQDIAANVIDFYVTFWGKADHEKQVMPNIDDCINSGFFEYQRLNFWWTNGGDTRPKFTRILDVFFGILEYIGSRSEELYSNRLLNYIQSIQTYEYYLEVLDALVYYLVEADCSMLIVAVGRFFKELHRLQVPNLCRDRLSYTLSKPGWVLIFKTLYDVYDCINGLKYSYIVFDDQNNRISNVLTQIKSLIKEIYRSFYAKLSYEWVRELDFLYTNPIPSPQTNVFLPLHLASGLSFVAIFVDDFRPTARIIMKQCNQIARPVNAYIPQQQIFHDCLPVVQQFLQDRPAIRKAQPFLTNCWRRHLPHIFQTMPEFQARNASLGTQLRIDLNAADNYI